VRDASHREISEVFGEHPESERWSPESLADIGLESARGVLVEASRLSRTPTGFGRGIGILTDSTSAILEGRDICSMIAVAVGFADAYWLWRLNSNCWM